MIQANYRQAQGGFWAALIPAVMSLIGSMSQNKANEESTAKQIAFQQSSLDQSQAFAAQQSSSAHQREVKDLRAAGLNPVLSGTGGMGSASPSASGMPGAKYESVNALGNAVSTAMEARRNKAEVDNMRTQNIKINEETNVLAQQRAQLLADTMLKEQQRKTEYERTRGEGTFADIQHEQLKGHKLEGSIDQSRYGEVLRYLDRLKNTVSPFSSARQLFNQGSRR